MIPRNSIVISSGIQRIHLGALAEEIHSAGYLQSFITCIYPTATTLGLLNVLGPWRNHRRLQRLRSRGQKLPDSVVRPLVLSEILHLSSGLFGFSPKLRDKLMDVAFQLYGRSAIGPVREAARHGARLYHFRSGFGLSSAREAKKLGLKLLCHHTIAHPEVLAHIVENGGRMPPQGSPLPQVGGFWRSVMDDLEFVDDVSVNSDFVKQTFVNRGWDPARVHVIYQGIDNQFLALPDAHRATRENTPLRLVYAGTWERRKGVDEIVAALQTPDLPPWELAIAGNIEQEAGTRHHDFLRHPQVRYMGVVSRETLKEAFMNAHAFLFPTLAEGSAKVVFEAMSCGCPVITTANAGSVVEHDRTGVLVPAGDAQALRQAIVQAAADPEHLADLGAAGKALVNTHYRQDDFGKRMVDIYARILGH